PRLDQAPAGDLRRGARRAGAHERRRDVRSHRPHAGARPRPPRPRSVRPAPPCAVPDRRRRGGAAEGPLAAHGLARVTAEGAVTRRARRGRRRAGAALTPARGGRVTAALLRLNHRTFASLRKHRNYRLFFTGQIVSLAGTWMQNVALAWYVITLTDSALAVGLLAFCRFAPFTVFGLYAGVLADRLDNRRLVMTTQVGQMVVSIALAALALSGSENVVLVYALALAGGIGLVFDGPGRQALTYQMVGREELPNAIALNSSLFNAARVIGPAIAGTLIAVAGVGVCFAINAVSFLAVLTGLLLMRDDELYKLDRGAPPTFLRGVHELFGYVRRTPAVKAVLATVAVVSTVGFNFHVILPLLASDTLHAG